MTVYNVRFGEIEAMVDTESSDGHTPEVARDFLMRLASTVVSLHAALPDDAPTTTEADAQRDE